MIAERWGKLSRGGGGRGGRGYATRPNSIIAVMIDRLRNGGERGGSSGGASATGVRSINLQSHFIDHRLRCEPGGGGSGPFGQFSDQIIRSCLHDQATIHYCYNI